ALGSPAAAPDASRLLIFAETQCDSGLIGTSAKGRKYLSASGLELKAVRSARLGGVFEHRLRLPQQCMRNEPIVPAVFRAGALIDARQAPFRKIGPLCQRRARVLPLLKPPLRHCQCGVSLHGSVDIAPGLEGGFQPL